MKILKEVEFKKNSKTKIIAIVGPTATGKSELALKLAQKINGEIISADSMQIYKKMNIATAKLSETEQCGIKHHLIDCVDLNDRFSVFDYIKLAKMALNEIVNKNKKPILVGGTGLYIDSFLNEINFDVENCNSEIRTKLLDELKTFGSNYLFEKLKKIDFEYAKKIHPNNHRRLVRALEIYYSTGKTLIKNEQNSKPKFQKLNYIKIGLNFLNRQTLYSKIDSRVDFMMRKGLLAEAELILNLCENCLNSTAKQAIGYKEFVPYFSGVSSLDDCVAKLKQNTRNLAKRQLTWFKKDEKSNWFFLDDKSDIFKDILNLVQTFFNSNS